MLPVWPLPAASKGPSRPVVCLLTGVASMVCTPWSLNQDELNRFQRHYMQPAWCLQVGLTAPDQHHEGQTEGCSHWTLSAASRMTVAGLRLQCRQQTSCPDPVLCCSCSHALGSAAHRPPGLAQMQVSDAEGSMNQPAHPDPWSAASMTTRTSPGWWGRRSPRSTARGCA